MNSFIQNWAHVSQWIFGIYFLLVGIIGGFLGILFSIVFERQRHIWWIAITSPVLISIGLALLRGLDWSVW